MSAKPLQTSLVRCFQGGVGWRNGTHIARVIPLWNLTMEMRKPCTDNSLDTAAKAFPCFSLYSELRKKVRKKIEKWEEAEEEKTLEALCASLCFGVPLLWLCSWQNPSKFRCVSSYSLCSSFWVYTSSFYWCFSGNLGDSVGHYCTATISYHSPLSFVFSPCVLLYLVFKRQFPFLWGTIFFLNVGVCRDTGSGCNSENGQ